MFHSFLRPGQGFQKFTVLSRQGGVTATGRPVAEKFTPVGEFTGIMMRASQGDVSQWKATEQWKQDGHPVLYKIIQRGISVSAKPGDMLELMDRKFYVLGTHNPAGLGHFCIYFAQERKDLQ